MYRSAIQVISIFFVIIFSSSSFAKSNVYLGTLTDGDKKNTYPVEITLLEEPRNRAFGIISYPDSSCSSKLIRTIHSDLAYMNYQEKGSCRDSDVYTFDHTEKGVNLTSYHYRDKELKNPKLTGFLTLSEPSSEFQLIIQEFLLNNPKALPVESSQFDLQSFPIFTGENSRIKLQQIREMSSFIDANCAVKEISADRRGTVKLIKLKDLPNCKIDKEGFKKYTERLYRQLYERDVNYSVKNYRIQEGDPKLSLAKQCIKNGFVEILTYPKFQQSELSSRVFHASNGPKGTGSDCLKHIHKVYSGSMPTSYNDAYASAPSIFTDWKSNPNKDTSLISDIAKQFKNRNELSNKLYDKFKAFDVVGIHIGQSLTELENIYPSLTEQISSDYQQLGFKVNYIGGDHTPINLLRKIYQQGDRERFTDEDLAQKLSVTDAEADLIKQFLIVYKSISEEDKEKLHVAMNVMLAMFSPYSGQALGYTYDYNPNNNHKHSDLRNKNITSLEIKTNVFRKITSIKMRRIFPNIINVKTLTDKIVSKYKALGKLEVSESTGSSQVRFNSPNNNVEGSFSIWHENKGDEATTIINYELNTYLEHKDVSYSLMPDLKKMFKAIIEANSSNIQDGKNIEI